MAEAVQQLLADTSVLIAPPDSDEVEEHRLDAAVWAISAMTIAELHKGVLLANEKRDRAARLTRLAEIEARFDALPFDSASARALGGYIAEAKRDGTSLRARDAIIAATAEANELTVLTRDEDFTRFEASVILLRGAPAAARVKSDRPNN